MEADGGAMIDNQRGLFDIPEDVTFLNCAARSPLLKSSRAAGEAGVLRKVYPWDDDIGIARPKRKASNGTN